MCVYLWVAQLREFKLARLHLMLVQSVQEMLISSFGEIPKRLAKQT